MSFAGIKAGRRRLAPASNRASAEEVWFSRGLRGHRPGLAGSPISGASSFAAAKLVIYRTVEATRTVTQPAYAAGVFFAAQKRP